PDARAALLEHVGEGPVGDRVGERGALQVRARDGGGGEEGVVHVVPGGGRGRPLRDVDLRVRVGALGDDLPQQDQVVEGGVGVPGEVHARAVLGECEIGRVQVGRDEV